ncbi:MAG: hypothetical protein JWL76_1281 [Thermoleophilia bacterium]|nr:hypothetical protein [Thermoleophilia bacterium]
MRIASMTEQQQPQLRNIHLTSRVATDDPTVTNLTTLFVDYDTSSEMHYGGHRTTSRWVDGQSTGIGISAFLNRPNERVAAQAVLDAIVASGLLTATLPPLDWKNPEVGRTRLYLDRRSRFLEFDTAAPPAVALPILDALAAYEIVARRNVAAA